MRSAIIWLAFLLLIPSAVDAQLTIETSQAKVISGGINPIVQGDLVFVDQDSRPKFQTVSIVDIISDAANINVSAETKTREPVATYPLGTNNRWAVVSSGRVWVRVTAIDFDRKLFHDQTVIVQPDSPDDGDEDDSDDDDQDDEDDPPDVPNEYGLGKVALENATFSPEKARAIASIYRKSADFLYGIPSFKRMTNPDEVRHNDPKWSVAAYQSQQWTQIGVDQAWLDTIGDALVESQRQRPAGYFTRQDWWHAFNEIATALEAVK